MGRYNPTSLRYMELLGVQKAIESGKVPVLAEYLPENGRYYILRARAQDAKREAFWNLKLGKIWKKL